MTYDEAKKINLPDAPGVYFWKEGKTVIYIGRATSLRDRVLSYFSADLIASRGPRLVDMVTRATSISYEETDSVLEAIIAEANLIKKYQPLYNVKEKDNRSWNYVVVTKEPFPRVLVIRGRTLDIEQKKKELPVAYSFGPFPQSSVLYAALKIIRKMFPFIDTSSSKKDNYHFYRQIGLTPDTASSQARSEYRRTIRHLVLFFQGRKGDLVRSLEREMRAYARAKEFEKASEIKRKLFALDHIQDIALVKEDVEMPPSSSRSGFRIEAYDTAHISGALAAGVMTVVVDGEKERSEYRKFKLDPSIGNDDVRSLREILTRRFAHPEWHRPDLIVIDGGVAQKRTAETYLSFVGLSIPVVSVVKDERHRPREILGDSSVIKMHEKNILLANAEAHRFSLAYHRKLRKIRSSPRRI